MISILGIIIIPLVSFAAQFAQLPTPNIKKALSEVNPMESVGNVLAPLNDILGKLNVNSLNLNSIKDFVNKGGTEGKALLQPLKPALGGTSDIQDRLSNTSMSETIGTVKAIFIFAARIFVAILETLLWIFKGILNLVT